LSVVLRKSARWIGSIWRKGSSRNLILELWFRGLSEKALFGDSFGEVD
jgi:hypothetical protein